ncbi:hypothetical protein L7F22_011688 [Adiantum nelumboides]|nr:hypothetical protein [Adiantum nelumboides]
MSSKAIASLSSTVGGIRDTSKRLDRGEALSMKEATNAEARCRDGSKVGSSGLGQVQGILSNRGKMAPVKGVDTGARPSCRIGNPRRDRARGRQQWGQHAGPSCRSLS